MLEIRRHLHRHPELSHEEERTAARGRTQTGQDGAQHGGAGSQAERPGDLLVGDGLLVPEDVAVHVAAAPLDVVKTRIQNVDRVKGVTPKYRGAFTGILLIYREEGFRALYKGFAPKVLRLAPGGGILLLVVEAVSEQTRRWLGPPYVPA